MRIHTSALCVWATELLFMEVFLLALFMSGRKLSEFWVHMCQDISQCGIFSNLTLDDDKRESVTVIWTWCTGT